MVQWWNDPKSSADEELQKVRKKTGQLIEYLEESSEEESDEDEGDEEDD